MRLKVIIFFSRFIWLIFVFVSIQALFSIPKLGLELLLVDRAQKTSFVFSFIMACAGFSLVLRYYRNIVGLLSYLTRDFSTIPRNRWLFWIICLGVALRLLWTVSFPAIQRSDQASYFELARKLANGEEYYIAGTYSYWPPGYPFFLSVFFRVFGIYPWVPTLANLVLFVGTTFIVFRLSKMLSNEYIARFSILLLAIWPNYITLTGLASKELLLVLLLPLVILIYLNSVRLIERYWMLFFTFLVGISCGYISLIQPSMLLFPAVFVVYETLILSDVKIKRIFLKLIIISIGMMLVIIPWTLRNHTVLNKWVLISTNGGGVFAGANNSFATGRWTKPHRQNVGEANNVAGVDEAQASSMGFRLGIEWILKNPKSFFWLALKKQVLFLGDDTNGIYETLKRGLGITNVRYLIFKALSNFYWWGIWMLMLVMLWNHKSFVFSRGSSVLLILSFFYLYFVHSIFMSDGKYHVPLIGLLAALAAMSGFQECEMDSQYHSMRTKTMDSRRN